MDTPEINSDPNTHSGPIAHILVVDDELAMRESLREILELKDFKFHRQTAVRPPWAFWARPRSI